MVENPVLEEIEESSETLDERSAREGDRERSALRARWAGHTYQLVLLAFIYERWRRRTHAPIR